MSNSVPIKMMTTAGNAPNTTTLAQGAAGTAVPAQIGVGQQIQPGMQVQPGVVQQRLPPQMQPQAQGQQPSPAAQGGAKQTFNSQQLQQIQFQQLHHMPQHPIGLSPEENEIISRRKLHELVAQLSPHEKLDAEVEEVLIEFIEDFIEQVTSSACNLAKHRNSTVLEVKDLMCHLERNWNIKIPGYSTNAAETVKSYKKPFASQAHQTRLGLVKKSMAAKKPKLT